MTVFWEGMERRLEGLQVEWKRHFVEMFSFHFFHSHPLCFLSIPSSTLGTLTFAFLFSWEGGMGQTWFPVAVNKIGLSAGAALRITEVVIPEAALHRLTMYRTLALCLCLCVALLVSEGKQEKRRGERHRSSRRFLSAVADAPEYDNPFLPGECCF